MSVVVFIVFEVVVDGVVIVLLFDDVGLSDAIFLFLNFTCFADSSAPATFYNPFLNHHR